MNIIRNHTYILLILTFIPMPSSLAQDFSPEKGMESINCKKNEIKLFSEDITNYTNELNEFLKNKLNAILKKENESDLLTVTNKLSATFLAGKDTENQLARYLVPEVVDTNNTFGDKFMTLCWRHFKDFSLEIEKGKISSQKAWDALNAWANCIIGKEKLTPWYVQKIKDCFNKVVPNEEKASQE